MFENHDKWFFWVAGAFFLLTATRFGPEIVNLSREPDNPPDRIARRVRWNVLLWRFLGTILIAYGVKLAVLH